MCTEKGRDVFLTHLVLRIRPTVPMLILASRAKWVFLLSPTAESPRADHIHDDGITQVKYPKTALNGVVGAIVECGRHGNTDNSNGRVLLDPFEGSADSRDRGRWD